MFLECRCCPCSSPLLSLLSLCARTDGARCTTHRKHAATPPTRRCSSPRCCARTAVSCPQRTSSSYAGPGHTYHGTSRPSGGAPVWRWRLREVRREKRDGDASLPPPPRQRERRARRAAARHAAPRGAAEEDQRTQHRSALVPQFLASMRRTWTL